MALDSDTDLWGRIGSAATVGVPEGSKRLGLEEIVRRSGGSRDFFSETNDIVDHAN